MATISDTKTAFAAEGAFMGPGGFCGGCLCMRPDDPVTAPADGAASVRFFSVSPVSGACADAGGAMRIVAQEGGRHG